MKQVLQSAPKTQVGQRFLPSIPARHIDRYAAVVEFEPTIPIMAAPYARDAPAQTLASAKVLRA